MTEHQKTESDDPDVLGFRTLQSIVTATIRALHESGVLPQEKIFATILEDASRLDQLGKNGQAFLMKKYVEQTRDIFPE